MAVTAPADVIEWIPEVISSSFYDRLDDPNLILTGLAARFGDVTGKPGDRLRIVTDTANSPAINVAVDVPLVDDKLGADSFDVVVKEAGKSIAWYDRTQVQAGQDVNQIAGRKVGTAVEERIELDLGAALYAGRTAAADKAMGAGLTVAKIRAMKLGIPARLRKRGLILVGNDASIQSIYDSPDLNDAAKFGSDEIIREGDLGGRPLAGVKLAIVDDEVLPNLTVGGTSGPSVAMFAAGMLLYGFQKNPSIETERDARARLTRHVGTTLHVEGVLDAAGVVFGRLS